MNNIENKNAIAAFRIVGLGAAIHIHRMKTVMRQFSLSFVLLMVSLCLGQVVSAQSFAEGYYRLTTQWLGDQKSLDIVNDGQNNQLQMYSTSKQSGQYWKITALGGGFFRLTTLWQGELKSLDVVNDGENTKLQLAKTENVLGQYWKITPLGNGYYRLTTKWLGDGKSLDILNDASKNKLRLAASGNFTGQFWKIARINEPEVSAKGVKFVETQASGFKIFFDPSKREDAETKEAIGVLSAKFEEISRIVRPKQLQSLRKVPVWIEFIKKDDGAMWYHPNKDWLSSNGYSVELTKSVEIKNVRHFLDWQRDQPYMVLHELAHGYQDQFMPHLRQRLESAYKSAQTSGKYDSVGYVNGGKQKAYALTTIEEYFAELTEAYFGKNDYYPFTKSDLKEFDPEGFKLMQDAWDQ